MITEMMVFWLVLCVAVAILAYLMHSMPVSIISSLGFFYVSLMIFDTEGDYFVLVMLWMIAFMLPFVVDKNWRH